jgi:uncharacterized protein YlzI (FlbEa/FlbD family)
MGVIMVAATLMITLNGLDGQMIYVNPTEIVSVRAPSSDLLAPEVKCTLQTADGKLIHVTNACDDVLHRIGRAEE